MWKLISESLIKVLNEFGVVGVLTYVAGLISLRNLLFSEKDFKNKLLFGAIGLVLFVLSWILTYLRMKIQRERERALIEMVTKTCVKLADTISTNYTNEQIVSITQSIWQTQKDLIEKIVEGEFKSKS